MSTISLGARWRQRSRENLPFSATHPRGTAGCWVLGWFICFIHLEVIYLWKISTKNSKKTSCQALPTSQLPKGLLHMKVMLTFLLHHLRHMYQLLLRRLRSFFAFASGGRQKTGDALRSSPVFWCFLGDFSGKDFFLKIFQAVDAWKCIFQHLSGKKKLGI